MKKQIICDRFVSDQGEELQRATVWHNNKLEDLFVNRIENPDITGAKIIGKVVRLLKNKEACFLDAGLDHTIFLENTKDLKEGALVTASIKTTARQGKPHIGKREKSEKGDIGIIRTPPMPWQRALIQNKDHKIANLSFGTREDFMLCQAWLKEEERGFSPDLPTFNKNASKDNSLNDIWETLLSKKIQINSKTTLTIEQTEAITVIDVDSEAGNNALSVNLTIIPTIADQIRWRNLGGIIVIDALKMTQREDKAKIMGAFKRAVQNDPANVHVWEITKLGLIEITRERSGLNFKEMLEKK